MRLLGNDGIRVESQSKRGQRAFPSDKEQEWFAGNRRGVTEWQGCIWPHSADRSFRAGQPWDQSSNGILDWMGCGTSQELAFGPKQGREATPGKPATYCMTT